MIMQTILSDKNLKKTTLIGILIKIVYETYETMKLVYEISKQTKTAVNLDQT